MSQCSVLRVWQKRLFYLIWETDEVFFLMERRSCDTIIRERVRVARRCYLMDKISGTEGRLEAAE